MRNTSYTHTTAQLNKNGKQLKKPNNNKTTNEQNQNRLKGI